MASADSAREPQLTTEEDLQAISVEKVVPHNAPITLAEYDPRWPALFDREAARIRAVLGGRAVALSRPLLMARQAEPARLAVQPVAHVKVLLGMVIEHVGRRKTVGSPQPYTSRYSRTPPRLR